MKIKSFVAPDMRTALRKIRETLGADAVILSTRSTPEGIEVVASLGYDEAALARVLRAAEADEAGEALAVTAPAAALATPVQVAPAYVASSPVAPVSIPAAAQAPTGLAASPNASVGTVAPLAAPAPAAPPQRTDPAAAFAAALDHGRQTADAQANLRNRALARLRDSDGPTLDELTASMRPAAVIADVARSLPLQATVDLAPALDVDDSNSDDLHALLDQDTVSFASLINAAAPVPAPTAIVRKPVAHAGVSPPALSLVPAIADDIEAPAIVAMREEMAQMRQLMEIQMAQLERERLRGSPARTAAFEAMLGFGCDEALAQAVAAQLDPTLPVDAIHTPMIEALARMLEIAAAEPVDDGGVIALVGPTGAGKTTTAAKLAARFAARHRARDVALITTDCERPGAHEQLQAHGRKLGITVCEARGMTGLQHALAQLADYPLVLVDTTGYAPNDRALFNQILWLRSTRRVRSLLVLPANGNPQDMHAVIRRYRPCSPEGLILTKLDETGYLGAALSVTVRNEMPIAYVTNGQRADRDLESGNRMRIAEAMANAGRPDHATAPSHHADLPAHNEIRNAV